MLLSMLQINQTMGVKVLCWDHMEAHNMNIYEVVQQEYKKRSSNVSASLLPRVTLLANVT
jgi:hypothetical protein